MPGISLHTEIAVNATYWLRETGLAGSHSCASAGVLVCCMVADSLGGGQAEVIGRNYASGIVRPAAQLCSAVENQVCTQPRGWNAK